jgi:hypothetical protein
MSEPMPRGKKILFITAILFTLTMIGFAIDLASRTTRPGAKKQLQERITKEIKKDSVK